MSLKLLIDEDLQHKQLVNMLRQKGHDVVTVNEVGLQGKKDSQVLNFAKIHGYIVLTRNCRDYNALHRQDSNHPGILGIYKDNAPSKDMSYKAIIKAIVNIETTDFALTNQFISLNAWNY